MMSGTILRYPGMPSPDAPRSTKVKSRPRDAVQMRFRPTSIKRLLRYAFFGGAVGFIIGVGVLLVIAAFYGELIGLSPGHDLFFALTVTMFLSQPAGITGMVVGATVGVMAGAVIYYMHYHMPRASG